MKIEKRLNFILNVIIILLILLLVFQLRYVIFRQIIKIYWYFFPSDNLDYEFNVIEGDKYLFIRGIVKSTCYNISDLEHCCPLNIARAQVNGIPMYINETNLVDKNSTFPYKVKGYVEVFGFLDKKISEDYIEIEIGTTSYLKSWSFRCEDPWPLPNTDVYVCSEPCVKKIYIEKNKFQKKGQNISLTIDDFEWKFKDNEHNVNISGRVDYKEKINLFTNLYTDIVGSVYALEFSIKPELENIHFNSSLNFYVGLNVSETLVILAYSNDSFSAVRRDFPDDIKIEYI